MRDRWREGERERVRKGGMLAKFQQTCECRSVSLSKKKDGAVVAGPEMKVRKRRLQFLKDTDKIRGAKKLRQGQFPRLLWSLKPDYMKRSRLH